MKWNLRKSDTALGVGALLTVVVLAWGAISVRSQDKNLLGNEWKYSSTPRALITAGAGGIEFGNSSWLNGEELVVAVVNPSTEQAAVRMQLRLGISPCGELPELTLSSKSEKDVKSGSQAGEYIVIIGAKRVRSVSFDVSGNPCWVKSDSRTFIGSIETPAITS
jgi:hypothetical protein